MLLLSLVYGGTAGGARQSIGSVMGIGGASVQELGLANKTLLANLANTGPDVYIRAADSVWIRSGISPSPAFVQRGAQLLRCRGEAI